MSNLHTLPKVLALDTLNYHQRHYYLTDGQVFSSPACITAARFNRTRPASTRESDQINWPQKERKEQLGERKRERESNAKKMLM